MTSNKESYKGIYAMHKYWGKKPFNEISKFIEKYSMKGDIVMDCFCGSGVTLIEALKAGRKCIGIDLNPIAIKLAKVSMTPVPLDEVQKVYKNIEKKLKTQINSLYTIPHGDETELVTHVIWKNSEPIEVWSKKGNSKEKIVRKGNLHDVEMSQNPSISPKWFPTSKLFENSRINVGRDQTVADLFTKRALVGLSLLLDEIQRIENVDIRDVFEIALSGTLSQASNLVFVIRGRSKKEDKTEKAEVGSWVIGYWVPEEHFEINAWNCFENRFKRVLRGLEEINTLFSGREKPTYEDYSLLNRSSTSIPCEDNSIDYVFIDPPHANRVLYMEQSLMWNAWLRLDSDIQWKQEIIVSEAKDRKDKNEDNYNKLLDEVFSEIKRVLKVEKYFSLAFNCLDDDTWINMLNLFVKHGFEIVDIVPLEYSATSVIQDNRKNALKTDFVLTFKNTTNNSYPKIEFRQNVQELKEKIIRLLANNPSYEVYNVMNSLFEETIPKGYIYKVSQIVKLCADLMP